MKKNKVADVRFDVVPKVCVRVISPSDDEKLIKDKKKKPFRLLNDVIVTVFSDDFDFSFKVKENYIWNGADIPKPLWWIGSGKDNDYLIASMVHDFMLEFKEFVYQEVLKECITMKEYRRLTSLIFREILKASDIWCVKANVMSWCVDFFQATFNRNAWSISNLEGKARI